MIEKILELHQKSKPTVTETDGCFQIGCHLQEFYKLLTVIIGIDTKGHSCRNGVLINAKGYKDLTPFMLKYTQNFTEGENAEVLLYLCNQIISAVGVGYAMGFDMEKALNELVKHYGNTGFENGEIVETNADEWMKLRQLLEPYTNKEENEPPTTP